ncbi:MAG TPA: P-loop NTPase [Syntrophobacteraceae bacterium]|nr:P-loop NTPase [Syntrophobacteraceae bacterium]
MLPLHELKGEEIYRIRVACAFLFSVEQARDDAFVARLDLERVTRAFREKAKRYHPDLHRDEPREMIERRKERLLKVMDSYDLLRSYLRTDPGREGEPASAEARKRLIAVGGAKGGIGKSLFAANLGVLLSSRGYRVVLVDLDLGGANLHLYLGKTFLPRCINDFLEKRTPRIEDALTETQYGPGLIGGDSSRFGAANIGFSRKIKLIKSIKRIDADYVILDLGGDTSFNIIDFFLSADIGIVMATCDPAAYLEAYNFIKVALYRKLNRIFGEESDLGLKKDERLARLIARVTSPADGRRAIPMSELVEAARKEQPQNLFLIQQVLQSYRPKLVLNLVEDQSIMMDVAGRIQEVARKMLSTTVDFVGCLPLEAQVQHSARTLTPVTAQSPQGLYASHLAAIAKEVGIRTGV